ncbi:MAG: ChbG/HpnK family deacetylase, partial [Planctomycetaceae bacterium]
LATQIESLLDAGAPLRHLNGHQYVECLPLVSSLVPGLAHQYGLESVRVACEENLGRVLAEGRWTAWGLALVKREFARRWRTQARAAQLTFADSYVGTAHAGLWETSALAWCVEQAQGDRIEVGLHPGVAEEPGLRVIGDWSTPGPVLALETVSPGSRLATPERRGAIPSQGPTRRTEVELPRGSSGSQFGSREQRHGSPVVGETGKGVPATDGWDDPLAKGRPKELAMLTSAEFAARLAAGGCVLGRLAEWRQAAALPTWRKAG